MIATIATNAAITMMQKNDNNNVYVIFVSTLLDNVDIALKRRCILMEKGE